MFDLEQSIAQWRREMLAGGIAAPVPLEELESHLREDLQRLMESGSSAQDAFSAAARRIGGAGTLGAEFAKVGRAMSAAERKWTWILCAFCLGGDILIGVALLLNITLFTLEPIPLGDRILGAAACFSFGAILWSWRYLYRFLPVVSKRIRLITAVLGTVLGGVCTALLMSLIPEGATEAGQFVGAAFWAFLPWVVGATLFFGLEEAAHRETAS